MPFKIRTKLVTAFLANVFPFIVIVGAIALYNTNTIHNASLKVETISEEVHTGLSLQLAIDKALMPGNDYISTGDKKYIDEFNNPSRNVEDLIGKMEKTLVVLEGMDTPEAKEEMEILKSVKTAWQNIKDTSQKIFAIPEPVGDKKAATLMEEMDYKWAYPAIKMLDRHHEIDRKEHAEAIEELQRGWRMAWIAMIGGGIILTTFGIFSAGFFSRRFTRPIEAIHNGADKIAGGDFKTRLDIRTGDELQQLSNAMNEMASQLDSFTANLEGMVEKRTKELDSMLDASKAVLRSHGFTDRAQRVFDNAKELIGASAGYVALMSEDGTRNEVVFLDPGGRECTVDPSLPMPIRGLREQAYRTGKAVYDNDFLNSEWMRFMPEGHVHLDNVLFAPLFAEGKAAGLIGLANKPGGFNDNDARLLSAFGDIATIALLESTAVDDLKESEERFRVLGKTAPNAIICLKAPDTITFWNRRAVEIFGYSEEEVVGKSMHALIVPERYREKAIAGMKRFFETGTGPVVGKTTELSALRRDGTEFPIELSLSAMNIGGNWQATGIVRDITDRKQAEDALRNSEERFRQLFEVGNDAVFVHGMTPDGKPTNFIEVNEVACKRLGYTREELLKMSPLDIDASEMTNQRPDIIKDFISNKKAVFEMVHVAKDGKHIPVEIGARLFELKGQKMALSIARDITDRKKAEAVIRQERDRAQMYLDVAGVMFVAIDLDERVILINKKGCEALGYGYDEIVGQNWFNTFIPEISRDDVKGAFTKLISEEDGSVEYFKNPVLRKDCGLRIIAWHNTVIRNEAGDIVTTLSSGEDITERKKAEDEVKKNIDELERFQKITVKREFRIKELNDEVKALKLRLEFLEKK